MGSRLHWALLVLSAHLLLRAECLSNGCSYSHSPIIKCVNKNLTRIPSWIPSNITCLDLSYNPLLKIQETSLLQFTNLTELKLSGCRLDKPFRLPETLRKIDLKSNLLSIDSVAAIFKNKEESSILSISIGANNLKLDSKLSIFPRSVRLLDLVDNKMTTIQVDDFKGLPNLRTLILQNTGIQSIVKGAFDYLKQLSHIDLKRNRIKMLPRGIFQFNANIRKINMESNYLTEFPDLTGIKCIFDVSLVRNRIKHVDGHTFGVHTLPRIDLSLNEIESFNFAGVRYVLLNLGQNRIRRIQEGSLGNNPFITALNLSGNNITVIESNGFRGTRFINELHLQRNNLQQIEEGAFRNMSIKKLLLFKNNLTDIAGILNDMKGKPHLLLLFGNPHITTMKTSDFQGMAANSKIYVSCRSITAFSSPFAIKAKLICSPSTTLMIVTVTRGLLGNGFICLRSRPFYCYPCKPGEYDIGIDSMYTRKCMPCPYGAFYQDEIASINCKECPKGQYVPPDKGPGKSPLDCLTCPKGTNTNTSAGFRACPCLPGYSRTYRFGGCQKCTLDGFQCKRDYPELRQGYWMSWNKMASCKGSFISFMLNLDTKNDSYDTRTSHFKCNLPTAHKCPIAKSCKGGVEASCERGYTGVLCALCDSGYMKQFNKCVECPSPVVSVMECVAYFLLFVILCWLMSKLNNVHLVGDSNGNSDKTFADLIQSSLKILMGFYQVLVQIFNAFSSIQWPSTLTHAVKVFEFIQLSVLKIPSLHCIRSDWSLNAINEFWISLIAMAAVPSLIVVYGFLSATVSHCVSKQSFRQTETLKNCLQSIVFFFFATYTLLSANLFHVLPASCHRLCTVKENGHCLNMMSYLRSDYSVECPNTVGDNRFNVIYAYVSLVLPFGLPCLLLHLLWRFAPRENEGDNGQPRTCICDNSHEHTNSINIRDQYVQMNDYDDPHANVDGCSNEVGANNESSITSERRSPRSVAQFALKMTYGNYKTSCWYWEFIEMTRKLTMIIASSFLLQNIKIGLYSNILLSIVFVVIHARKWPMKDSFDNYMQLLALASVTVNLCYSVTKTSSIGDADIMENDKDVFALGLMLVTLNSLLVILIVGRFVKEVTLKVIPAINVCSCRCCCDSHCCNALNREDQQPILQLSAE